MEQIPVEIQGPAGSPIDSPPALSPSSQQRPPENARDLSLWFKIPMAATFVWIFIGISGIFGYRMWWNSPIHPSFLPFAVVAFAVVVSYSIVLSLDMAYGSQINFEVGGQKLSGATGPTIFWVLSFLAIMYGFSFVDFTELAKSNSKPNEAVHRLGAASVTQPSGPEDPEVN